jgi:hypothetical protein
VDHPQVGTQVATGDQSGNDVAAGGGRPLWPALFYTDLTENGGASRAGDWQQGGQGFAPHRVCGTWKAAVRTVDKTRTPNTVTVTPDNDPAKNDWNIAGGDVPPGGFAALADEGYGAECVWFVSQLGLKPGHTYRMYFMVHDGDQNKTGGDAGHGCTTVHINASTGVPEPVSGLPREFSLSQNIPNPFGASTSIRYTLPQRSTVHIEVMDLLGRQIATLVDGDVGAGEHAIVWRPADQTGRALPPGLYMYRMRAVATGTNEFHQVRKMLFVR